MKIANRKFTSLKLIFIISLGIALMGACSKKKTENTGTPNGRVIINNDDESTDTKAVKLELIATDKAGVTGYYISEEQTDPDPDMEGWESVASAPEYSAVIDFELSDGLGTKTLYAWFKNDEAKISPVSEDSIQVTEPAPYDITIKINEEATTTASRQITLALSATDSMGITGYYILESPVKPRTPAFDIAGWVDIESITNYDIDDLTFDLTSSGVGEKTVYVWFKNTLNIISSAASATIELTAKAIGTITINHGLDSTISETVPVIISATDEVGITGYYISEEATPPTVDSEWNDVPSVVNFQFTIPAFTLSDGVGDKTLYVWFKNESDVISEVVSATIAKKLPGATSGSISINAGETTTTSRDLRITLAASDPNKVTGYYLSESSTVPDENTPWLTTNQATRFLKTISYTLTSSTYGDKIIYAWFKNSRGIISDEVHASIRLKQHPAPQNGKIVVNNGIDTTTAETIPITLSASDEVGVTGYYISETGTAPAVDSSDWVAVTSTTSFLTSVSAFTLSAGTGDKTIYAWFKNGAGLISAVTSATIEKKLPGAATAAISINSGDRSTTSREVNLTLVASDPNKVTGYYLSESSTAPDENASWQTTEQATNFLKIVSYSLTSSGYNTKTIYAWFKNGRGVISDEVHASIRLKQHPAPQNGRIIINNGIDTTTSETVSVTLSASDEVGVTGYYISETQRPPRATASGWVNVSSTTRFLTSISAFTLSSGTGRKTIYAWFKNGAGLVSAAASAVISKEVPGAPSGSISINSGQATTISREISLTMAASDPNKVMKYYFSESSTTPGTGAAWETASGETSFFKVISYTLTSSGYGDKTIYAWFKNSKGIVSNVNDKIKLEKLVPASGIIIINDGAAYTTRSGVKLQLITTSPGVTGYYVKEVNSSVAAGDNIDIPAIGDSAWVENSNYPVTIDYELSAGNGEKYIYVFYKNATGVSSSGSRDTIIMGNVDAPTGSISINSGDATTTSRNLRIVLMASDANKVTGYYLSESSTVPDENTPWLTTNQATRFLKTISYTLTSSTYGDKTIYVWFKNSRGIISDEVHASIRLKQHPAPQNGRIIINNGIDTTTSETVSVTLSASDEVGVTGYYISETQRPPRATASGWVNVSGTTSFLTSISAFTLSSGTGRKTIYAWFKNGAGLVSAAASAVISKEVPGAPSGSISINSGQATTISREISLTLAASDPNKVMKYYFSESSTTPGTGAAWETASGETSFFKVISYTLTSSGYGDKTIYAWFKNSKGIVSNVNDKIKLEKSTPANGLILINGGAVYTAVRDVHLQLITTSSRVTGYYVTEVSISDGQASIPSTDDSAWVENSNYPITISHRLSAGDGEKYVYVFFKNAMGVSSDGVMDTIMLGDVIAPNNVSMVINNRAATTSSVNVTLKLFADDNAGVVGYFVSENTDKPSATNSGWKAVTSTTSYREDIPFTLSSSYGIKVVYAWFKDARNRVSAVAMDSIDYASPVLVHGSLMWQKFPPNTKRNWSSAISYCDNLVLDSHSDWRLPNDNELSSIIDRNRSPKTIPELAATTHHYGWDKYWTTSLASGGGGSASYWRDRKNTINFRTGYTSATEKQESAYYRCVRSN